VSRSVKFNREYPATGASFGNLPTAWAIPYAGLGELPAGVEQWTTIITLLLTRGEAYSDAGRR
jgi:hypothetical protein